MHMLVCIKLFLSLSQPQDQRNTSIQIKEFKQVGHKASSIPGPYGTAAAPSTWRIFRVVHQIALWDLINSVFSVMIQWINIFTLRNRNSSLTWAGLSSALCLKSKLLSFIPASQSATDEVLRNLSFIPGKKKKEQRPWTVRTSELRHYSQLKPHNSTQWRVLQTSSPCLRDILGQSLWRG